MDKEYLVKIFRGKSFILNPSGNFGSGMEFLNLNDRKDIDRHLLRLLGSDEHPEEYYLPDRDTWQKAVIPSLKLELDHVKNRIRSHQQKRVKEGFKQSESYPKELTDEIARIEAHLLVSEEEIAFLKKARENAPKPFEELREIKHRRNWGAGSLLNGVLIERGGFRITPDDKGLLRIDDTRSQHNGMEAWRFTDEIVKPMSWEFGWRVEVEKNAARSENRPFNEPDYPEPGIWHRESDVIEYPNYDQETLSKCLKK